MFLLFNTLSRFVSLSSEEQAPLNFMAAVTFCNDFGAQENLESINIAGRNINNLRYAHDTTLMAENEEELKSLLMKVKEESKKAGLKLNI